MWRYVLIPEAIKDFKKLDGSQKKVALAMLEKLEVNPLPKALGGYGALLGNDIESGDLTGFLKLKARGAGLRIVYKLEEYEGYSKVIVIGVREDKSVYKNAVRRIKK